MRWSTERRIACIKVFVITVCIDCNTTAWRLDVGAVVETWVEVVGALVGVVDGVR